MPVSDIVNTTQHLPSAPQGRERNIAQPAPAPVPFSAPNPAAVAATAALTPAQQAALLINKTLQDLNFELNAPLDVTSINSTNPLLTAIGVTDELPPDQAVALLINENLLDLNLAPPLPADPLLIDETNPIGETIAESVDLSPSQQAGTLVNETLRELSTAPPALTPTEVASPALPTVAVTPARNPFVQEVPTTPDTPAGPTITATAPVPEGLAVTVAVTTPTAVTAPQAATTVTPASTPATQTLNLLATTATSPRDPTPFAFAAYEIRDPHPAPEDPKPIRREVGPPLPPGRVRPVDRLVLRREWGRRREGGRQETSPDVEPAAERSIHQVISQANEDLSANGLPLRLVLASSEAGYSLDIYDCSSDDMCRLEKEVPLDLNELATLLDNIRHESGMIINLQT